MIRRTARPLVLFALASALATGCTPSVTRTGYAANASASSGHGCHVAVKRGSELGPTEVDALGEIDITDSGFSTSCDETVVIGLLRREACAAGADIANIVEEHRPDMSSTCYRARARFLRLRDRSRVVADDPRFVDASLDARGQLDSDRQSAWLWGAVIAGVVGGVVAGVTVSAHR
jgi:hypothetical protein